MAGAKPGRAHARVGAGRVVLWRFTGHADAQTTGVVTGRFTVTGKATEIPEK